MMWFIEGLMGFFVGLFFSANTVLPIVYGVPVAIYQWNKQRMLPMGIFVLFIAPVVWSGGVVLLGFILVLCHANSALAFITSGPFSIGTWVALACILFKLITAGGRAELYNELRLGTWRPYLTSMRLITAAGQGDDVWVMLLAGMMSKDGDDLETMDNGNKTALVYACQTSSASSAELLINYGANVHVRTKYNLTPLHFAAGSGNVHAIQALIQAGADIEARTDNGATPLTSAIENGQINSVAKLISSGANVNCRSEDQVPPVVSAQIRMSHPQTPDDANVYAQIVSMLREAGAEDSY